MHECAEHCSPHLYAFCSPDCERAFEVADFIRATGGRHVITDWDYSRDTGDLLAVYYNHPEDRFFGRVSRAFGWLFRRSEGTFFEGWGPSRWVMFRHVLRRDRHLPDGQINGNLTFWEEEGEYMLVVQPGVGMMFADFFEAEPHNPWVIQITTEMKRHLDRYGSQVQEGTP